MIVRGEWCSRRVWVDGHELLPEDSQKLRRHSPDGFNWGYGGSGPAQLALDLLSRLIGKKEFALSYYQEFKWRVIAKLPQGDFQLTVPDAEKFIMEHTECTNLEATQRC